MAPCGPGGLPGVTSPATGGVEHRDGGGVGIGRGRLRLLLLVGQELLVVALADDLDPRRDRALHVGAHHRVAGAADEGADDLEVADLVGRRAQLVDLARRRVDLHAPRGHPEAVDDVLRLHLEVDLGVHRHDQLVDVLEALARVVVGPVELLAPDRDRHVGVAALVVVQRLPRDAGQGDDDDGRDGRPDDLEAVVAVDGRGDPGLAAALAEQDQRRDQDRRHQPGDAARDDDHDVVDAVGVDGLLRRLLGHEADLDDADAREQAGDRTDDTQDD